MSMRIRLPAVDGQFPTISGNFWLKTVIDGQKPAKLDKCQKGQKGQCAANHFARALASACALHLEQVGE